VRGILSEREVGALAERALSHGGLVSCADGPYELNINYFDALSDPESDETIDTQVDRFMVAQAIMLALAGVPGIYFHSLFGSRGWPEGVRLGGGNRAINRQKCDRALLEGELSDEGSLRSAVFRRYKRLLRARAAHPSFHPQGEQRVLDFGEAVLALLRRAPNGGEQVLCLHNVTGRPQTVELDLRSIFGSQPDRLTDLTAEQSWAAAAGFAATLSPYQALWLRPGGEDHHG
jgi:sucrose phosphorylase